MKLEVHFGIVYLDRDAEIAKWQSLQGNDDRLLRAPLGVHFFYRLCGIDS